MDIVEEIRQLIYDIDTDAIPDSIPRSKINKLGELADTAREEKDLDANNYVLAFVEQAVAFCYDACHKLYLLMDESSAEEFINMEYQVHYFDISEKDNNLETIADLYENSCPLKFIDAVYSVSGSSEYVDVIPQAEYWNIEEGKLIIE